MRSTAKQLSQRLRARTPKKKDDYFKDTPGSMPGTLYIQPDAVPPEIVLIDYGIAAYEHRVIHGPEEVVPYLDTESVAWVDVDGLGSQDILQRLGQVFKLHPLVLEDIVNVPQRPKVEEYDDQVVIITRMVLLQGQGFITEQVSFILGKYHLLTVQEEPNYDCFEPVRDRIRCSKGIIRKMGADYLAYSLLDAIVDGFFPVLEFYGEMLEQLEDEVVANPSRQTLQKIHHIRRELLTLRRAIWPQRDAINSLIRDGHEAISDEVRVYLRDCYDHAVQVLDMVETYREVASSLMDIYLSSVGNKMNEIMKFLTVISSIFIPLTFIAGVYGMNFEHMPELKNPNGYFICVGVMIGLAIALLAFFISKGWFANYATTIETDK